LIPSNLERSRLEARDYWMMLESLTAGTFLWWPARDAVEWSPKLLQTLGHDAAGAAELGDLQDLVHPDDVAMHANTLMQAMQGVKPYRAELRMRHTDGSYRHVSAAGCWMGPVENPTKRLLGFALDVTEAETRRAAAARSETLFRAFFDNAPVAAFIKDRNDRHLYGNALAADFAGTTLREFLTRPAQTLYDEATARMLARVDRQVVDEGETVSWQGEVTTTSGAQHVVLDTRFPFRDPRSGAVLMGGLGIDVTRQDHIDKALSQAQKLEALGHLVAGIAHDFNNTLAVLQGNLEVLEISNDPEERALCQAELTSAVDRGARLTQQLLAYGRKAVLRPTVQNLNTVLGDFDRLLRRTLPESIEIETVLGGGLWNTRIDRDQVENAVLNLALNARDAMPSGGRLTIETANVRIGLDYIELRGEDLSPGRYVMLAVSDTGSGMSPEVAARAFDPFFTTKPVAQGAGMGLAMVYGLLKQCGGTARLYSEPGVGTTVKLYFPTVTEPVEPATGHGPARMPGDEHILLVEDEAQVRSIIARQLANLGYEVTTAASGAEGLACLQADPAIALMITDIVMPGDLQGPDLAARARDLRPDLPVIFISGYPLEAAIHSKGLLPGDVNLTKPVALAELSRAIRDKLD
jgi:PAS domain S-box-containing protein